MAVEEIVKENTPKAEGEAQGVKYISLTEEELERLIKAAGREGAKKGVEAYERRKEKDKEELADKVKNSAKTIIIHYRQENEEYIGNRDRHGDRSYAKRNPGRNPGAGKERRI